MCGSKEWRYGAFTRLCPSCTVFPSILAMFHRHGYPPPPRPLSRFLPSATALVMTPLLDDAGALAVKMQYVPAARIADLPPPPPPRGTAASEGATEEEALVTAGGEAGAGAVGSGIAATRPSSTGSIAAAAAAAAAARFFSDPSPPAADAFAAGYMTDDEYGIGAEGGAFIPGPMALAEEEAAKPAKAEATPAKAEAKPSVPAAAAGGADSDKPKSPWVLYVSARTASLNLAMSIVGELAACCQESRNKGLQCEIGTEKRGSLLVKALLYLSPPAVSRSPASSPFINVTLPLPFAQPRRASPGTGCLPPGCVCPASRTSWPRPVWRWPWRRRRCRSAPT